MSKAADVAINLLIVVLTFVVMMVLGWTVKKIKGVFRRKETTLVAVETPLAS